MRMRGGLTGRRLRPAAALMESAGFWPSDRHPAPFGLAGGAGRSNFPNADFRGQVRPRQRAGDFYDRSAGSSLGNFPRRSLYGQVALPDPDFRLAVAFR
jgi:hypothetical protein